MTPSDPSPSTATRVAPLAGRVALITGASRGIGRAIALELATCGAEIACTARDVSRLEETCQAVVALGRECLPLAADVAVEEAMNEAVLQTLKHFGRVEILVNNAGIVADGLLMRMRTEDWRRVLAVNLDGIFYATRAVARPMIKQRAGRIVNLSSIVGFTGNPGQVNYSSTKAAIVGFTRSTALELASRNITCNAVAPGYIHTDMTASLNAEQKAQITAHIPLGRTGTAEEIAHVVRFLVSDDASYITGSVIHVNGGLY